MQELQINHVTSNHNGKQLLDDVSMSFQSNRIYGIIGHNGAGKTSLFRCLRGLIDAEGTIVQDGLLIDQEHIGNFLKAIGVLLPFSSIYDTYSIKEIIEEHLFYMECSSHSHIENLLEKAGLSIDSRTPLNQLSLGMKQKVAIALAFAHQPTLFLLDEPFNGLDHSGIVHLKKWLKEVCDPHHIILISSHSFGELEDLIDEVLVLKKGKLIANTTIARLKEKGFENLEIFYRQLEETNEPTDTY